VREEEDMGAPDPTSDVTYMLTCYSREDDSLVSEHPLYGIDLEQLKASFRPPEVDPRMYDSYPVGPAQAELLGRALGKPLDLRRYNYFVECDARDVTTP
jgi:hypothetical protein